MSEGENLFEPHPVLRTLRTEDPLKWVKQRLDKVVVGEDNNKIVLFLSKLTYLMDEPTHEVLKGPSGVGKSYLGERVLEAFPNGDVIKVSRVTEAFLDRCKNLKHKIFFVHQLGGAESAQNSLHVMLSERGLQLGTVKRGKEGEWESYFVETEGPISFCSTTTTLNLDPQLETRCFHLYSDMSEEQPRRIQQSQQKWDETPWLKQKAEEGIKEIKEMVEFIKKSGVKRVVVPFSRLITLPSKNLRIRRDRPKLMALVKSLAMLRQWQRFVIEVEGERYVLAEWQDFTDIAKVADEVLTLTLQELGPYERKLLRACWVPFGAKGEWFNAKQASSAAKAEGLDLNQRTARRYLNRLVNKGYVFLEQEGRGRGMTNMYSINEEAFKKTRKTVFAGLTVLPKQELRKALKAWVTENIRNGRVEVYKYDDEGRLTTYGYIKDGKLAKAL